MDIKKSIILIVVLALIGGSIFYLESKSPAHVTPPSAASNVVAQNPQVETPNYAEEAKEYPRAQELVAPDGFINTNGQPITISSLIGKKVILVDFWAYSCINCQRTIPYLNSWYQKYASEGLEIIGVHSPEFDFEKQYANVQAAVEKFNIQYPVVLDNELATWDAYMNEYWPEEYLIDINGFVVDRNIGEGGYQNTEKEIQTLLAQRNQVLGQSGTINATLTNIPDASYAQSPETYFGSARNQTLANGQVFSPGIQTLSATTSAMPNELYLDGSWNFQSQYAENTSSNAKIFFTYNAKDVYFVASANQAVTITVLRDGQVVQAERGDDVNAAGQATIQQPRLYKLINEESPGTHTLEIIVNQPGLEAFTFTFG